MPDENAVLHDVTSPSPAVAADAPEPAKVAVTEPPAIAVTDNDAAELGRTLMEAGYTKDKMADLLQAPQALTNLRYLLANNPTEFWNLVQRNSPDAYERHEEYITNQFLERNKSHLTPPAEGGDKDGKGTAVTSELMGEVEALRSELSQFKTRDEQRQQQAQLATVQSRYNARVDDLFGQLPKDIGLTKTENTALRALLDKNLADDPIAVQRVSQGNFVDVPKRFQSIIEGWAADRKAAADAAEQARENSKKAAHIEFPAGASPFLVDVPTGASDSWDATEAALAKAFEATR